MKLQTILKSGLIFVTLMLAIGCTSKVPIGYVGMVQKAGGLTGDVLAPGRHECWGRSQMILIEISEQVATEQMKILCADELNFGFDLKIRAQINTTDGKGVKDVLNKKGSAAVNNVLAFKSLYDTYVAPQARAIARGVVSKYQTTEIRQNREKIDAEIKMKLEKSLEGTPMTVNMVASSNYDYPAVITEAMEKKRKREIEIDEKKAEQAVKLLEMDNRLKLAQKAKVVRATEAEAEAIYNKILGNSLTPSYLALREIEAKSNLYEKVGAGDKVIVDSDSKPFVNTGK